MTAHTRSHRRTLLIVVGLLLIISLFLCAATFFLWLSMGANIDKLPTTAQEIIDPLTSYIQDNGKNSTNSPESPSDDGSNDVTCSIGFVFDSVLNSCVQVEEPEVEITDPEAPSNDAEDATEFNETCSAGLFLDPILNICVQVEEPGVEIINSEEPSSSGTISDNCTAGLTFDPILDACVKVDIQTEEPEDVPLEIIENNAPIPIVVETPPAIPTLPSLP